MSAVAQRLMRPPFLLLATALLGVSSQSFAEPLEQPTVTTTLKIERERGGACAEVHAGAPGATPVLEMTDVCHGWATASCSDQLLVRGNGVTEDQAQVLFTEENRAIDLVPLVDGAIRKRWPGDTHLHLQFGPATCDGDSLALPFSGSHLRANTSGSASSLQGSIRITEPGVIRVSVRAGN